VRYLRLLFVQVRTSLQLAMQYRWDFLLEGLLSVFGAATALLPLFVAFSGRPSIAGWTFPESLVVLAWFTALKGLLDGAIHPSLLSVVDHIRQGTLDFVLLKPADAQFLVSTARFSPWRAMDVLVAVGILVYAFAAMDRAPGAGEILAAIALLFGAILILYSIWILVIAAAFRVVRIDNLAYLFMCVFDAARWPASIFRGAVRVVLTFILPLTVMTTLPAEALLGRLDVLAGAGALVGAVLFATFARVVWVASLRHYTSASS
jgi:ABC-2 type transport system permease protein